MTLDSYYSPGRVTALRLFSVNAVSSGLKKVFASSLSLTADEKKYKVLPQIVMHISAMFYASYDKA